MQQRRQTSWLIAGVASLLVIGILSLAFGMNVSQSGQAEEAPPLLQYPEYPPTPTVGPAPESGAGLAGANTLFLEGFGSEQALSKVEIVDLGGVLPESRSIWSVKDGWLIQDRTAAARNPSIQETLAVIGKTDWTDYTVSVKFYDQNNGVAGLVARRNGDSFYRYRMLASTYADTPKYALEKVVDGVPTTLAQTEGPGFTPRAWQTLSLSVAGSTIRVTLNGQVVAEATDTTLKSGQAGIYTRALGGILFDDLSVTAP